MNERQTSECNFPGAYFCKRTQETADNIEWMTLNEKKTERYFFIKKNQKLRLSISLEVTRLLIDADLIKYSHFAIKFTCRVIGRIRASITSQLEQDWFNSSLTWPPRSWTRWGGSNMVNNINVGNCPSYLEHAGETHTQHSNLRIFSGQYSGRTCRTWSPYKAQAYRRNFLINTSICCCQSLTFRVNW